MTEVYSSPSREGTQSPEHGQHDGGDVFGRARVSSLQSNRIYTLVAPSLPHSKDRCECNALLVDRFAVSIFRLRLLDLGGLHRLGVHNGGHGGHVRRSRRPRRPGHHLHLRMQQLP